MHVSITLNTLDGTVCVTRAGNKQFYRLGVRRDIDALQTAIQQLSDLVAHQQYMTATKTAFRQPEYA